MLFASLAIDREPLQWSQFPEVLTVWLQTAGGVAAFGVALVLIALYLSRETQRILIWQLPPGWGFLRRVLQAAIVISGLGYLALFLAWLGKMTNMPLAANYLPRATPADPFTIGDRILMISGALALLVAASPLLIDLCTRIRFGRVWAVARLSWKEAVRGRVIWVFGFIALIFLFADWFVSVKRPEDQVRSYVRVVYWSITPLFLITAGLLGAFSIPNDVKSSSIHTIVTKPVEKFEIVIGRFLGFAALLTIGLFVVSSLSLIYVVRGVNEDAAKESYKARVPYFGKLTFWDSATRSDKAQKAESVGREWGYRSYIKGPHRRARNKFRQYAIWDYDEVPPDLGQRPSPVRFEFTFDIFRLSKGEEGKGMFVTFTFADGSQRPENLDAVVTALSNARKKLEEDAATKRDRAASAADPNDVAALKKIDEQYTQELASIDAALTEKYGIYQVKGQEVKDFHTQEFEVPPQVFTTLLKAKLPAGAPPLRVFVSVDPANEQQMLGVAKQDFYLLAYEKDFWQNFLKGVIGMWCTHMIVLGVAVALSTYFSAVISLLCAGFLFIAGMNSDYLKEVAERRLDGGGPMESGIRLVNRTPLAVKFDASPTTSVMQAVDDTFSWWIRVIINLVPDVNRHDLQPYVANGFDISWFDLLLLDNLLPLLGYLLPWAVLAYYLMKYREIANPT